MADVIYKGFYTALKAGSLNGTPDIRAFLFMSGFSFNADSINLLDGTMAVFDGTGYAELDCAAVTLAYVDADNEMQLDFDNGQFGGAEVAAGSEVIAGMAVYLFVDGTEANDIILASTTTGGFGVNANNGLLSLVLPVAGLLFARQAA